MNTCSRCKLPLQPNTMVRVEWAGGDLTKPAKLICEDCDNRMVGGIAVSHREGCDRLHTGFASPCNTRGALSSALSFLGGGTNGD